MYILTCKNIIYQFKLFQRSMYIFYNIVFGLVTRTVKSCESNKYFTTPILCSCIGTFIMVIFFCTTTVFSRVLHFYCYVCHDYMQFANVQYINIVNAYMWNCIKKIVKLMSQTGNVLSRSSFFDASQTGNTVLFVEHTLTWFNSVRYIMHGDAMT